MFVSRSNKAAAAPATRLVSTGLGKEDAAVSRSRRVVDVLAAQHSDT
jgi:hypothetical protein